MQRKKAKGFTLIELLIVIAIIGLLATLAIVSLTTAQQKARDAKRIADMKLYQNAIELYFSENPAGYPTVDGGSADATHNDWADFSAMIESFMTQVPVPPDAATETYRYQWGGGTLGSDDATDYVMSATLEDATHDALEQSEQADVTGLVAGVDTNNADPGTTAACDPVAGEYCLTN